MFRVRFLHSSSLAVLNRCGAFLMVLMTFFTLGFVWSDRLPLPPDSTIVGNVELLFLLNEPKRSERDKERESGRRRCKVPERDALGEEVSVGDFCSSSVVTNLPSRARSFEFLFGDVAPLPDEVAASGSTSESCNNKEWYSLEVVYHHYESIEVETTLSEARNKGETAALALFRTILKFIGENFLIVVIAKAFKMLCDSFMKVTVGNFSLKRTWVT